MKTRLLLSDDTVKNFLLEKELNIVSVIQHTIKLAIWPIIKNNFSGSIYTLASSNFFSSMKLRILKQDWDYYKYRVYFKHKTRLII